MVTPGATEGLDSELAALIAERVAAAEARPTDADLRSKLALVYEANGLWQKARASYANALRLAPGNSVWQFHAAIARQQAGDITGALEAYRRLAVENPTFAALHHRLGDALLEFGEFDEAAKAFQRSASLVPTRPEPLVGLADIKLRQQDYPAAAALLEKARDLDSGYRLTHYLLGLAYRGLGRLDDARRELANGVDSEKRFLPDSTTARLGESVSGFAAHINQANEMIDRGLYPPAIRLLERALAVRPDDVNILNNLSVTYQKTGDAQKALELLRRSDRIDPNSFATHINFVECLLRLNRAEEALGHGRRAVELAPQLGQAQFALGRALYTTGRFEEARVALQETVRLDARNPEAFLLLGEACLRLNLLAEAKEHFQTTVQRMPDFLPAYINLGAILLRLGEYDEAAQTIETARRLAPNHPRVIALSDRLASLQRR